MYLILFLLFAVNLVLVSIIFRTEILMILFNGVFSLCNGYMTVTGVLYPPSKPCVERCSVVIATHGAGVEASNPFWASAFDQQESAWVLFLGGKKG